MTRSFGAPILIQSDGGVVIGRQSFTGRDFRAAENGEIKFIERDAVPLRRGDQFPGVGDRVFLEVIAEGKIAEHLEKRVMAIGEADIFKVVVLAARADAFLAAGGAIVIALFEAEENVLELVHSGIGEKQRGIVRAGRATSCARCDGRALRKISGMSCGLRCRSTWCWVRCCSRSPSLGANHYCKRNLCSQRLGGKQKLR